jgi:hypothetical protein
VVTTSPVPPNRLNCTVILVAMEGSQKAAHSWAAKMRSGLFLCCSTIQQRVMMHCGASFRVWFTQPHKV